MSNDVTVLSNDLKDQRQTFLSIRANESINFEAEAGFAIQTLTNSDYAFKVAMANRQSVINAVNNVSAIGISLNPAKKQAYLVPREGRICLDISYMGLLDLAIQSGGLKWGQAELVYQNDTFKLRGFDEPPLHERNPFSKDRGSIVGAYVVVKTSTGDFLTTCMSIDEVLEIRDRSQAWQSYVNKKARSCPWATDEGEMIKKTVIKRAYKLWPKSEQSGLEKAIDYLNREGGEGIEFTGNNPGKGSISGTDGAMASMSLDEQEYMRELAATLVQTFADGANPKAAFDKYEAENLDSDQKVALWSLLPSKLRSAIKKEGKNKESGVVDVQSTESATQP